MGADDLENLRSILSSGKPVRPALVEAIEHSLTRAEGNVEAFLANYAVLESLLGNKVKVDAFITEVEPSVEIVNDTRGRDITIYTKLRNAKGHPSGMAPSEASGKIRHLLPRLRQLVREALIRESIG